MFEPEALDRRLEELARVLGDLLALHRDRGADRRTAAMQAHARALLSELMELSYGVEADSVAETLAGLARTHGKATTRLVAVLLDQYIAALCECEQAENPFAEMRRLRHMQKVRANAQAHARLFAHALARETERAVTAGPRAMH